MHRRDVNIDDLIELYNDPEFQSEIQSFIVAIRGIHQDKNYTEMLQEQTKRISEMLIFDEVEIENEDTKSEYYCAIIAACDLNRLDIL